MKKILGLILILIGVILIGSGIFIQLNSKEENKDVVVDTSFKRVNNFNGEELGTNSKMINSYYNDYNYNIYNFSYPDIVHEYNLSNTFKSFESVDGNVKITIKNENDTLNTYLNKFKTKLISYKDDEYISNLEDTGILSRTIDGVTYKYLEWNYSSGIDPKFSSNYDEWRVGIEVNISTDEGVKTQTIVVEITAKNGVMSTKAIDNIMKSIKVEEKKAVYKRFKEEGNYLVGFLQQNKYKEYEHGYKLNFKIPKTIPEIDSITSNVYATELLNETPQDKKTIIYSIDKVSSNNTIESTSLSYYKIDQSSYKESDTRKNISLTKPKFVKLNGKDIYYYRLEYDLYSNKKYTSTYKKLEAFCEIGDKLYLKVIISFTNSDKKQEITEDFLAQYLNYEVEEY